MYKTALIQSVRNVFLLLCLSVLYIDTTRASTSQLSSNHYNKYGYHNHYYKYGYHNHHFV